MLEHIGGGQTLVELHNTQGIDSGAPRYAEIILTAWRSWRRIETAEAITLAELAGEDTAGLIAQLGDLQADAGVDELALDDMLAALDDQFVEVPTILTRTDGHGLFYANAVNMLHAEPGVGKSMLVMIACAEIIGLGGHVLYLDYEDTARRVAHRMVDTLGITRAQLADQFHYKRLYTLSPAAVVALPKLITRLDARLVVVDGTAEALAAQGYDENVGTDIAAWFNTVLRPMADTGAGVIIIDHVVKSRENRGRWSRGSGHKLAALDGVGYGAETLTAFSRERAGKVKLTIAKDRPACVGATGDIAATITIEPRPDQPLTYTVDVPAGDGGTWEGPTDCMALVRRLFTEHPDLELARSSIAGHLKTIYDKGYRDRTVREAADRCALDGFLRTRTSGKAVYFRLNPDAADQADDDMEMF